MILDRTDRDAPTGDLNPPNAYSPPQGIGDFAKGSICYDANRFDVETGSRRIGLNEENVAGFYRRHLSVSCRGFIGRPAHTSYSEIEEFFGLIVDTTIHGANAVNGHCFLL